MCTTCGCSEPGPIPASEKSPGSATSRNIGVSLLAANDKQAEHVRSHFTRHGTLAINLMSAPGSGKTALIERTLEMTQGKLKIGVLAGDLETQRDAERVQAKGAIAKAITTGQACHLDAFMVEKALEDLPHEALDLLFIENVGNLVCPSLYDVGAHVNVVLLSVTEGEDKPLKYPLVFRAAELLVVSKTDLLPYLAFDASKAKTWAQEINPGIRILELSAKTLYGFEGWTNFLFERIEALRLKHAGLGLE
jgi:hydrogenase nickel incorporation protein HypB